MWRTIKQISPGLFTSLGTRLIAGWSVVVGVSGAIIVTAEAS